MPVDERLAARARAMLSDRRDVRERKMFGGIAFMLGEHMFGGIIGPDLIVRLGNDAALSESHTRPMDFTGKPLKGILYVAAAGLDTDERLRSWLDRGIAFVQTLPPKKRARS